ncbi:MAG: hypothetical protein HKN45_01875 [Flavobacteriales bacterium]|nr:hypothetical protein [Flavobacteriales bacterium]
MKLKVYLLFFLFISSIHLNAIPFKLLNTGAKSIPLIIPGIMNPNLSPFSTSGVDLDSGQEIFFKHMGKRYLLLVVDKKIRSKDLNVNQLIRQKERELGIARASNK